MRRTVAFLLASAAFGAAAVASACPDEWCPELGACCPPSVYARADGACSGPSTECSEISDADYGRAASCYPGDAAYELSDVDTYDGQDCDAACEAEAEAIRARLAKDDDHGTVQL